MLKKYSDRFQLNVIFVVCSTFPLFITHYTSLFSIVMVLLSFMIMFFNKKLATLLFITILACIPSQFSEEANISTFTMTNMYCSYMPLLMMFFYCPLIQKRNFLKTNVMFFLLYAMICFIWFLINGDISEITILLKFGLLLAFVIIFYSSKITQEEYFRSFDIITIVYGIYYSLEFFFRYTPYESFFLYGIDYFDLLSAFRPNGLLGNPLISCSLFLLELVFIMFRYIKFGKINKTMLVLTLILCLLTVSRTSIVGAIMIISIGVYFKAFKAKRTLWKFLVCISIGIVIIISLSEIFLITLINRFSDNDGPDVGITFRLSGFIAIGNLFLENPFGVGLSHLLKTIEMKYAPANWIYGFKTLDNYFLTQIGQYGILAFIPCCCSFYWYIYIRNRKKSFETDNAIYYGIVMILSLIMLISFSFDWEIYNFILATLGSVVGLLIRDFDNNYLSKNLR